MRPLCKNQRLLEIGVGVGSFLKIATERGFQCSGVELNPVFRDHALETGRRAAMDFDIRLGSIEDVELPADHFDVVAAMSVFEHVRDWESGLRNAHHTLKPGGALYFNSTNKFALRSGEYPALPLYGWLPDPIRYRYRVWRQGERVVASSGLDFNQFTYFGLRRAFRRIGFSRVVDLFELMRNKDLVAAATPRKRAAFRLMNAVPPLRHIGRVFAPGTHFVCVK